MPLEVLGTGPVLEQAFQKAWNRPALGAGLTEPLLEQAFSTVNMVFSRNPSDEDVSVDVWLSCGRVCEPQGVRECMCVQDTFRTSAIFSIKVPRCAGTELRTQPRYPVAA